MIMNSMLRKVGYRDSNICRVSYKKKEPSFSISAFMLDMSSTQDKC